MSLLSAALAASFVSAVTAESVLGIYVFHRHGDRTSKSWPPTALTALGADQVYESGTYFRDRYVATNATHGIVTVQAETVKLSQISLTSATDNVLQASASFFAQGLYPAAGTAAQQTLANGTVTEAPLDGYQYVPVNAVASAASSGGSEDSGWLQGSSGCGAAVVSSNNYFYSTDYLDTLAATADFYTDLLPAINTTFTSKQATFKNAYTIYDYLHVAEIHNASIAGADVLTDDVLAQLYTRANQHEWGLAYNASEPIRAISGAVLAGQALLALNVTAAAAPTAASVARLNFQFGAYGTFMSLFGLLDMPAASPDFTGIVDYASAAVFELVTNASVTATSAIDPADLSVRFLLANGSAPLVGGLTAYPMFGTADELMPWTDFSAALKAVAVEDTATWCSVCGNSTGICSPILLGTATTTSSNASSTASGDVAATSSSGGISRAVAGVIGAMVTLGVILGLEAIIMLVAGLRIAKRHAGGVTAAASAEK